MTPNNVEIIFSALLSPPNRSFHAREYSFIGCLFSVQTSVPRYPETFPGTCPLLFANRNSIISPYPTEITCIRTGQYKAQPVKRLQN